MQNNKLYVTTILFLVINLKSNAQLALQWAHGMGASGSDFAVSSVMDNSGNLYVCGWFSGTFDADPGTAVFNLTSVGSTDAFVAKYNSSGGLLWAKSFGGTLVVQAVSLALDNSNNHLWVAGNFNGTADFNPGTAIYNKTSAGNFDGFFSQFDLSGNFSNAFIIGGPGNDFINDIQFESAVFIAGSFEGTANFVSSGPPVYMTSAGGSDAFFCKYGTSGGTLFSSTRIGGTGYDEGLSMSVDPVQNVTIAGKFSGTVDFNPGAGVTNLTSAGGTDIFIGLYDSYGLYFWANRSGSSGDDIGYSVKRDNAANFYLTGYFTGTADFDPGTGVANLTSAGSFDIFIAKYTYSGNFIWAKSMGSTTGDYAYFLQLDAADNVYITGYFTGTADFDPGAGTANLIAAGNSDNYIAKYDSSGNYLWAAGIGGTNNEQGYSLQVDPSGNVYETGYYTGSVDFDPGVGNTTLNSVNNSNDFFIAKYSQIPTGISDAAYNMDFNLYPNPFTNEMELTVNSNAQTTEIKITDVTGKVRSIRSYNDDNLGMPIKINTTELLPGIYFLEAIIDGKKQVRKIVKG